MKCGNNWPIGFKVEDKMTLDEGQKPMAKGNPRDSSDLKLCNFPPKKIIARKYGIKFQPIQTYLIICELVT